MHGQWQNDRVMRFRHRYRGFTHLALLAAVLLSTLPTLGRLQQALHATDVAAPTVALCTMRGLERVSLADAIGFPLHGTGHADDNGDGDQPGHVQDDCAYCPLLSGLLLPTLAMSGLAWIPPTTGRAWQRPDVAPLATAIPGLGSRGPPIQQIAFR